MQGVPEEVVKRAAMVLDAFASNNNVDKLSLDKISSQDQALKVFFCSLYKLTPLSSIIMALPNFTAT